MASGRAAWLLISALTMPGPGTLLAQGLPSLAPMNPMSASRSGLYFQPYLDPRPGWTSSLALDYASMVEYGLRQSPTDTSYLLDAEVMRLNLGLRRDLGPRAYVTADLALGGAYDGFLDGFLNWYHGLFGIRFRERELRPHGQLVYEFEPVNKAVIHRHKSGAHLEDLRLGAGIRWNGTSQTHLSVTLPTNTGPSGYGRGTVSVGLLQTLRAPVLPSLTFEGSAGLGYTPRHGDLAAYQKEGFLLLTSGMRWRFWKGLSAFVNGYFQTAYYHDTGAHALDGSEFTLDFGWILRTRGGHEWRIGMTEDPWPSGPAIDLSFRLGWSP